MSLLLRLLAWLPLSRKRKVLLVELEGHDSDVAVESVLRHLRKKTEMKLSVGP